MRWHVANWIGLVLALAALAAGLSAAVVIAREPHAAMQAVAQELGVPAAEASDYATLVTAAQAQKLTSVRAAAPAPGSAPLLSELEAARAALLAAQSAEAQAKARAEALQAEVTRLQAALSEAAEQHPTQIAGDIPRPCQAHAAPFRCILRFEPGSAGLDTVDRLRLARLVESIDALGLGPATIEIVGMADRRGPDGAALLDLSCEGLPGDADAQLACQRALSVQQALQASLGMRTGVAFAPARAQLALTPRPSPSYRRA